MHGGKSLIGPSNPAWRGKGYSEVLPKRLRANYEASINDPDKLALDNQIAVIDTRLHDLISRTDGGESGQIWRLLKEEWRNYENALRTGDVDGVTQAAGAVAELITRGHSDSYAWADVTDLIERRRKLVESERKRLVEQHKVISVEAAMVLLTQLVETVQEHVHDDDALRAISAQYRRIVGAPD